MPDFRHGSRRRNPEGASNAPVSQHLFSDVCDDPTKTVGVIFPHQWEPPLDIYETDSKFVIIAELPGVKKDQVHVSVEQNILTIEGERPKRVPSRTVHVHQMEIPTAGSPVVSSCPRRRMSNALKPSSGKDICALKCQGVSRDDR